MGNKAVLGSFIGVLVLITYRDFKHPDSTWPLGPVPPPYRYTYSAVIFGMLALVSDIWSEQIATVVAVGVLVGTLYAVISGKSATGGLQSNAPGYSSGTANASPASNGTTGSTTAGGGTIQA
jgi:hypothetical protein